MKRLFIPAVGSAVALVLSVARAQTPVRGSMPEQAVDTPQLFIPGQIPASAPASNALVPAAPALVSPTTVAEKNLVSALLAANQRELRVARLASARSQDPAVRAMAQAIIKENPNGVQAVATLQKSLGLQNVTPVPESRLADARFSTLEGAAFDAAILKEMQRARQSTLTEIQTAQRSIPDTNVQTFASATLPALNADMRSLGLQTALPVPATSLPALPNPAAGALPSVIPGTLSNPAAGVLPNVSTGPLPNVAGGNLSNPVPGLLPNPAGGALPSINPPRLPNPAGGALPSPAGGALPSVNPGPITNPVPVSPAPNTRTPVPNNFSPRVFPARAPAAKR